MPFLLAIKLGALISQEAQEDMIGSRASTSVERVCGK